jgi:pimeloyl-ACP methyl ester carboxylesterase
MRSILAAVMRDSRLDAQVEPREHFVRLRDKQFHYLEWGDPRHPILLLAHGNASSARGTWLLTAPDFADRFHILAIDHRGHGETDWDADACYSLDEFALDLHAFVTALDLPPFFLLAHSMGGFISMLYAADHADTIRALVLVDCGLRFGATPSAARANALAERPLTFASRAEAEEWARSRFPDAARGRNVGYGFRDLPDGTVTWRTDVVGLSKAWPGRDASLPRIVEAFGRVTFPIMLLRAGASGGISPAAVELMQATNPRLQVITYERAHHWLHQDEPRRFARDVSTFLATAGGPSSDAPKT